MVKKCLKSILPGTFILSQILLQAGCAVPVENKVKWPEMIQVIL